MTLLEATRKRINELCNANNMNINQLAIASGINPSKKGKNIVVSYGSSLKGKVKLTATASSLDKYSLS